MSERQTGATDETAMRLRSWSQKAGISNQEPWGKINDLRKEQWRRLARQCEQDGQVITDATRVPTDDELAAMGNVASWTAHFAKDGTLGPELKRSAELVRAYLERQR